MTTAHKTNVQEPAGHRSESRTIPIAHLVPAPYNARRTFGAIEELAASIRADGVLEPLVVRLQPGHEDTFEIICGARRAVAAKRAGLESVPCVVLDVGDAAAQRICAAENVQRETLSPMEEANAIAALVKSHSPEEVAADLGKPLAFVVRRARLVEALTSRWRKLANDGLVPMAHLERIVALGPKEQDELAAYWGGDYKCKHPPTLDQLERMVGDFTHALRAAPWKLDDAELCPKWGACTECTRHTKAAPGLFHEGPAVEEVAAATCLEASCWDEKTVAWDRLALERARADHPGLVLVRGPHVFGRNRKDPEPVGKPELSDYEYRPAKRGSAGAVPAFVVSGGGRGKVRWIKPGKPQSPSKSKARKGKGGKEAQPTAAERAKASRERWERRRGAAFVDEVRAYVEDLEKGAPARLALDRERLAALVFVFGGRQAWFSAGERMKGLRKLWAEPSKAPSAALLLDLWSSALAGLATALNRRGGDESLAELELARWAVRALRADAKEYEAELWARVDAAVPVPKALASSMGGARASKAPRKGKAGPIGGAAGSSKAAPPTKGAKPRAAGKGKAARGSARAPRGRGSERHEVNP